MQYKFQFRITAGSIWQLSMYTIYSNLFGLINIIFTLSMILITFLFWNNVNFILQVGLVLGVSLFPVIQPLAIYYKARKQTSDSEEIIMTFKDDIISIHVSNKKDYLTWSEIKNVVWRPTLLVLFTSAKNGYIIPNRAMGKKKKEFFNFVLSRV